MLAADAVAARRRSSASAGSRRTRPAGLRRSAAQGSLPEDAGALPADRPLQLVRDARALHDDPRPDGAVPVLKTLEPRCVHATQCTETTKRRK
jgi:hypothetical protein